MLGELAPKWIALERPEATAIWLVKPLELFMRVFWPFIRLVHGTAQGVVKMLGLRGGGPPRNGALGRRARRCSSPRARKRACSRSRRKQMLHRVFGFADLTAGQVMIPRTELVAVAADTPLRELLRKIGQGEPTRLPVYREDLDDVIGMLHVVDLVKALGGGDVGINAGALAREVLTVPITLGANDLLAEMRRRAARARRSSSTSTAAPRAWSPLNR